MQLSKQFEWSTTRELPVKSIQQKNETCLL